MASAAMVTSTVEGMVLASALSAVPSTLHVWCVVNLLTRAASVGVGIVFVPHRRLWAQSCQARSFSRTLPSSERPCSMLSPTRRLCSRTVTSHLQDGTECAVHGNRQQILMLARPLTEPKWAKSGSHFSLCCLSAHLLMTGYAKTPAASSIGTAASRGWASSAQQWRFPAPPLVLALRCSPARHQKASLASKVILATPCCASCCTLWFTADMQSSTDSDIPAPAAMQMATPAPAALQTGPNPVCCL